MATIPLTDTIAHAVAQIVDDFVGQESIANAKDAFAAEGFVLERMDSELRC